MRALDLFCGAGGVSEGLRRAGFEVIGVDIAPQPHYRGGTFVQADALTFPLDGYDFIWASPPCQAYTALRTRHRDREYPDLITAVRERLLAQGSLWCIENVPGAPLGGDNLIRLCGTMFGLQTPDGRAEIRRHRLFELSFCPGPVPVCQHGGRGKVLTVVGHTPVDNTRPRRALSVTGHTPQINTVRNTRHETFSVAAARAAMDIDWMPMRYLSQAIPPAYAEWIGREVMNYIRGVSGR